MRTTMYGMYLNRITVCLNRSSWLITSQQYDSFFHSVNLSGKQTWHKRLALESKTVPCMSGMTAMSNTSTVDPTLVFSHDKGHITQEQQQQHESAGLALATAQEEVQHLSSVKQQADAIQSEMAAVKSAHEAVQGELAVAKGRLSGFDESCQLSLDRVQSLSAALQEAQQAKVESPTSLSLSSVSLFCHSRFSLPVASIYSCLPISLLSSFSSSLFSLQCE